MAIYPDLLNIVGKEQQIRDMQGLNSLRAAEVEQIQKQSALADKAREVTQQLQLAQDAQDKATAPPAPPTAADSSISSIQKQVAQAQADYSSYSKLAAGQRRAGVDAKDAEARAQAAETALYHANNALLTEQKTKAQELHQTAGAVAPDGSNVGGVVAAIDRIAPGWSKSADLDRDLMGNVTWGPKTKTTLAQTQKMGETVNNQITDRQQQARLAFDEKKLVFEKEDAVRKEKEATQRDTLAREGLELKKTTAAAKAAKDTAVPDKVSEGDIKREATWLQSQNKGLPAAEASVAAEDYLRKTNELVKGGVPRTEAQAQARKWVQTKIETTDPGKPYVAGTFGFGGQEAVPPKAKYNRDSTPAEPMTAAPEVDAGIKRVAEANGVTYEEAKAALKAAGKIK